MDTRNAMMMARLAAWSGCRADRARRGGAGPRGRSAAHPQQADRGDDLDQRVHGEADAEPAAPESIRVAKGIGTIIRSQPMFATMTWLCRYT